MKTSSLRRTLAATATAAACAGLPAGAGAQDAPSDERVQQLERKLEQSLKQIEDLTRKVERLEARTGAPASAAAVPQAPAASAPAAAAAPSDARVDDLQAQVQQLSQSVSRINSDTGVPLHGFASVEGRFFTHTDPNGDNVANGAVEKAIDFYLAPDLGPRVKTLMEIAVETSEYGQSVGIDMERLQIGYVQSDALTVWAGRFHTPYGYWNTAFHHGAQIQTSIQRPKFLAFEDTYGLMPAHTVGLWATGKQGAGGGRITYDLTVGNSPRILTNGGQPGTGQVDMNLLGSNNHSASMLANVGYEFGGALDGLKLGVDAMKWRTTDDVAPLPGTTDVGFVGAYGAYTENDWEVLGEYYAFHDRNVSDGGSSHASWLGYLQVGRTFGDWTPYARWEAAHLDQGDGYFAALAAPIGASYRRYLGGARYDLTRTTALKFEYNSTVYHDRALPSYNEYALQVAVRF